jgi:mannose-6-phosphate isomerase-like protein (cupin superfamily)
MCMGILKKADLPRIGSSFHFVGSDQGDVNVSIFFVEAEPGRGAPLHVHDYDEIVIVQEGSSRIVLGDVVHDAGPGDILVIKAGTPHGFVNAGQGALKQIDIHTNPCFVQKNLESTETSRRAGLPLRDRSNHQ